MWPELVAARQLFGARWRSTLAWGVAFGTVVYTSSAAYVAAYPEQQQRLAMARTLAANDGLAALFGATRDVATVGGFTAWRSLGVLSVVGAIWGVLTGGALLRGEEDAGRWGLVVAGRTTRARATTAGLLAAAVLLLELAALTSIGALLGAWQAGLRAQSVLFLALVLVLPAALFACVGLVCGQLTASRGSAVRLAGVVFGSAYLLRLVATTTSVDWLLWCSPLGWTDAVHPMTGSDLRPLALILVVLAASGVTVVALAARRDEGAGCLPTRSRTTSSRRLLRGPTGLALRQGLPRAVGWFLALGILSGVFGLISGSVSKLDQQSGSANALVEKIVGRATGTAAELGLVMSVVGSLLALAAAGYGAALRQEETDDVLAAVLVQPISRRRWLVGRVAVACGLLAVLGLVVSVVLAVTTSGQDGAPSQLLLLQTGLNVVPMALTVLGLAVLVFGVAPRAATWVPYALVASSFLIELVGSAVSAPSWFLDLSLLHHVALAPAIDPDWVSNAVLFLVGAVAAGVGVWRFSRRDLVPG